MEKEWTAEDVLSLARTYQAACVLSAAVDLDLFARLTDGPCDASALAGAVDADLRGTTILLDALAAMGLLDKEDGLYSLAAGIEGLLTDHEPGSVLAMARHHGNCMRRWVQLAGIVKSGRPAERVPSIQGEDADAFAFIEAMDNVSAPTAPIVFDDVGPLEFRHVMDIGGGPGTWLIELLRRRPEARGTLFDLSHVIPIAQRRLERAGMLDRVELVAGDFYTDPLPRGADLVWLGAIAHQNSRAQNRDLLLAIRRALVPGGHLLLRDVLMDEARTSPPFGALFAVNMLVATESGGTFTFEELREDLERAGFRDVALLREDTEMSSVVRAWNPA